MQAKLFSSGGMFMKNILKIAGAVACLVGGTGTGVASIQSEQNIVVSKYSGGSVFDAASELFDDSLMWKNLPPNIGAMLENLSSGTQAEVKKMRKEIDWIKTGIVKKEVPVGDSVLQTLNLTSFNIDACMKTLTKNFAMAREMLKAPNPHARLREIADCARGMCGPICKIGENIKDIEVSRMTYLDRGGEEYPGPESEFIYSVPEGAQNYGLGGRNDVKTPATVFHDEIEALYRKVEEINFDNKEMRKGIDEINKNVKDLTAVLKEFFAKK
jgi:hypothetical protein